MNIRLWMAMTLCGVALAAPAGAEITATDLQIAGRALGFMEQPLSGRVRAGIVYSAADPRSVRQAENLQRMLEQGSRIGNIEMQPVRVEIGALAGARVDLFFMTDHIGEAGMKLFAVTSQMNVPCVTTDIAQVRSGACVMGIRSRPKVEILVNRAAALESDTRFATVFRMMVTEL